MGSHCQQPFAALPYLVQHRSDTRVAKLMVTYHVACVYMVDLRAWVRIACFRCSEVAQWPKTDGNEHQLPVPNIAHVQYYWSNVQTLSKR